MPLSSEQPVSVYEAVLGPFNPLVSPQQSVMNAYNSLLPEPLPAHKLELEMHRLDLLDLLRVYPPSDGDKVAAFRSVNEIVQDTIRSANTLVEWPNYAGLMATHGRAIGGTALMIGTMSPLSSRSFNVLANEVYGADRSVAVDLSANPDTYKQGTFAYGDGLHLPFADSSISYVHTNRLLDKLTAPNMSLQTATNALFSEIGRVLVPGGQLFMNEVSSANMSSTGDPAKQGRYLMKLVTSAAQEAHIETVIEPSMVFTSNRYLLDPHRRFKDHPHQTYRYLKAIYGRKPEVTR